MQNRALDTGLRCVAHPITLTAIALLLLNDHVFKSLAPSWLTGKLSDFAGLFFFPLLVATLFGLLTMPLRNTARPPLAQLAFALTAGWFTAIKILPEAAQQTQQLASLLLGRPAIIVCDPTDLIALVSLWPAWRLWMSVSSRPSVVRLPAHVRWLALGLATLATVATSPSPPPESVQRIIIAGDRVGAVTICYRGNCNDWMAYETSDGGLTWAELWKLEGQALEELKATPVQHTVADPQNPKRLYRVVPNTPGRLDGKVEKSEDQGQTWITAWQIPTGRDEFMLRYPGVLAGRIVQMGPFELGFTPDNSGVLLVALGDEGLLRKDPQGRWTRHPVGAAEPTPYRTVDPRSWFSMLLFPEGAAVLLLVVVAGLLMSPFGWFPLFLPSKTVKRMGMRGLLLPTMLSVVSVAAIVLLIREIAHQPDGSFAHIIEQLAFFNTPWLAAGAFLLFMLSVLLWALGVRQAKNSRMAADAQLGCIWTVARIGLVAILPLILWAIGVIPWLQGALGVGAVLVLLTFAHGGVSVYRRASRAVDDAP